MNQPNKQSLIAMIEAYAASKAEVALESNRPDQDCGYSLLQKEKKCVENKENLFNFIEKLNLDTKPLSVYAKSQPDEPFYGSDMEVGDIDKYFKSEIEKSKKGEPSDDSDYEYNYDTDNDPLISM